MSNWELDPAFFLTSRRQAPAPAEELACVICSDPSCEQPETICVVDVNPTSRTYGEVAGEVVQPAVGGASGQLFSNMIAFHMQRSLNWSLAAALAAILLGAVLLLYWLYDRLVGIDNMKLG